MIGGIDWAGFGSSVADWWNGLWSSGSASYVGSDALGTALITEFFPNINFIKNPDPFARPNQKKQGREKKAGARKKDDFMDRSNKRRPKPPKKHTPGKDHRKEFILYWLMRRYFGEYFDVD